MQSFIQNLLLETLDNEDNEGFYQKSSNMRKSKIVQVIQGIDALNVLIVHDLENKVGVVLTDECADLFKRRNTLSSLKNKMIKLQKWHFSSLFHCAANRDLALLQKSGISRPIVIFASKAILAGGHGLNKIRSDNDNTNCNIDLNESITIKRRLESLGHIGLLNKLKLQLKESQLPDINGKFTLPRHYNDDYSPRIDHCMISNQDLYILNSLGDHMNHATILMEQKRLKEMISNANTNINTNNHDGDDNKNGGLGLASVDIIGSKVNTNNGSAGLMWKRNHSIANTTTSSKSNSDAGSNDNTAIINIDSNVTMSNNNNNNNNINNGFTITATVNPTEGDGNDVESIASDGTLMDELVSPVPVNPTNVNNNDSGHGNVDNNHYDGSGEIEFLSMEDEQQLQLQQQQQQYTQDTQRQRLHTQSSQLESQSQYSSQDLTGMTPVQSAPFSLFHAPSSSSQLPSTQTQSMFFTQSMIQTQNDNDNEEGESGNNTTSLSSQLQTQSESNMQFQYPPTPTAKDGLVNETDNNNDDDEKENSIGLGLGLTQTSKTKTATKTIATPAGINSRLPESFIGRRVRKLFKGHGTFSGKVSSYAPPYFMVTYSDGDSEEMCLEELKKILVCYTKKRSMLDLLDDPTLQEDAKTSKSSFRKSKKSRKSSKSSKEVTKNKILFETLSNLDSLKEGQEVMFGMDVSTGTLITKKHKSLTLKEMVDEINRLNELHLRKSFGGESRRKRNKGSINTRRMLEELSNTDLFHIDS